MSDDIILDFDQENVPVAIEILHASKVFGVNKYSLTQRITLDINVDLEKTIVILEHFLPSKSDRNNQTLVKTEAPTKSHISILENVPLATA